MPKIALLIGCNYTNHPVYSLKGCIDDVQNVEDMLNKKYGYLSNEIIVLTDESVIKPTKSNIMAQFQLIVDKSAGLDEVWIHYSGHGSRIEEKEWTKEWTKDWTKALGKDWGDKWGEGILIPLDYDTAGPILADELYDFICKIKCPAMLLFDSCHSGNICEMPWHMEVDESENVILTSNKIHEMENLDIYVFSGCKEIETCADEFDNEIVEHVGAFTTTFLKCLYDNQSDVSIDVFYKTIVNTMKMEGFSQRPVLASSGNKWDKIITKTIQFPNTNRVFGDN